MKLLAVLALFAFGIARLAVAAEAPPNDAYLLDHAKMADAFAKALPLVANSSYKIQAGHRVMAGIPEVHEHDTDILYVIEGAATFVTGGNVVEPKTSGPGEVRGKEIQGGVARQLTKGDVMVIPSGVPHWFKEVNGTINYFVVKVTK
ncbi:MAG: hypothetical protein EXS38_09485 [Opitutus sp.]|nr:hypothetical protein [Opitutus sp.]